MAFGSGYNPHDVIHVAPVGWKLKPAEELGYYWLPTSDIINTPEGSYAFDWTQNLINLDQSGGLFGRIVDTTSYALAAAVHPVFAAAAKVVMAPRPPPRPAPRPRPTRRIGPYRGSYAQYRSYSRTVINPAARAAVLRKPTRI